MFVAFLGILAAVPAGTSQDPKGQAIYRKMCSSCHGARGEGTKDNPDPLVGKRSLAGVADYITRKMPEGAPKKVVGEDAKSVARYIYDAFYSPAAQLRNKPPRIELSRLTNTQYRNVIADLAGQFATPAEPDKRQGIKVEFFNSGRRFRSNRRVHERIDSEVKISYGDEAPVKGVKKEEHAIQWSGTVFAPETGEYEFIVETKNGARLWVNRTNRPLIDEWVRSGIDLTHRATILLLGGRRYPLRVQAWKAKGKDGKNNEKAMSVTLKWKRPHRTEEPLSKEYLTPGRAAESLVIETRFPPDDSSMGFERGRTVSQAWEEATTYGALEVAEYLTERLSAMVGGRTEQPDSRKRIQESLRAFVGRAFRRPLSKEERQLFVDRHFAESKEIQTAIKKTVLLALKSPRFLYPETGAKGGDDYETASRISFGLWDSIPDKALLDAAAKGQLKTREQISKQVERMIANPRTRTKIREFFHRWLKVDHLDDLTKDEKQFSKFNNDIVSDLRTSLDLFLDDVTWSKGSDFRQLMNSDFVYMNGRLAEFYGAKLPKDSPFKKVRFEPENRSGLVTHPFLMAGFAYDATSSPVHRGVWISRSLLGRRLKPPPQAVTPTPPDLKPELTTRERISEQTRPASCMSCHSMINPLGFSLENFDAVGRFRDKERGRKIDPAGFYKTLDGKSVRFKGGRELGAFLAGSREAQAAFVERLFQHLVKQPLLAHGTKYPDELHAHFAKNGYSMRRLISEMITTAASGPRNISNKGKGR